jgi:micrococcal nuclease
MYEYKIKVLRVVDGDTLDALLDIGFSIHKKIRVRLIGIDTPESRTRDKEEKKKGLASKAHFKEILKRNKGKVTLKSHGVGKFGRCLGELFVPEYECSVNQQMINDGYAYEYFGGNKEVAKAKAARKRLKKGD